MSNRIISFDGVRGIAVLSVVLRHCFSMSPGLDTHFPGELFRYGWLGVDLFFIISGFVISFTLYKYNDIKSFVIARFARLYPAYWAAIIFSAILVLIFHEHLNISEYLINLVMFQWPFKYTYVCGVFWTLSFELVFYVIAATIFYFGYFSKHGVYIAWMIITFFWQLLYFMGYIHADSLMNKMGYLLLLRYSPLFVFGIYLYKVFSRGWSKQDVVMMIIMATLFIILLSGRSGTTSIAICRMLVGAIFLLCVYATLFPKDKFLSSRCMVLFGRISYSWYLTHLIIAPFVFDLLLSFSMVAPYVSVLISFFVAYLFNKYIENPSHDFLNNYFNKRSYQSNEARQIMR